MSKMYGRSVIVECEGLKVDGKDLDIEFEVPFDDNTTPDEANVKIYNLSQKTIDLFANNKVLTIKAGYGNDVGIVFQGRICYKKSETEGKDISTTIYALDSEDFDKKQLGSIAYAAGTKSSYIIRDLLEKLGIPIAVFNVKTDYTHTDGVTIESNYTAAIEQEADLCNVSTYMNKGMVYVSELSEMEYAVKIDLSTETGLIESPAFFMETEGSRNITGYNVKSLLLHRATTGVVVNLKSAKVKGSFRIKKGKHICSGSSFYTEMECVV